MIDYKLALKLKDAGFDQIGKGETLFKPYKSGDDTSKAGFYIPILSELIEECGNRFVSLTHFDTTNSTAWGAEALTKLGIIEIKGKTPKEAVAKLWLKLNEENQRQK